LVNCPANGPSAAKQLLLPRPLCKLVVRSVVLGISNHCRDTEAYLQ
jgi:hypothetical protein